MSTYPGSELDLFQHARNWKTYLGRVLRPWVSGSVLEVGAGMGATSEILVSDAVSKWTCLEPDPSLAKVIEAKIRAGVLPTQCACRRGTLEDLEPEATFDVILYIDVLEHIGDDCRELAAAASRLEPNGRLVVLAPAHPWLYSPFDASLGHHRRYTMHSLLALTPEGLSCEAALYLDTVGVLASASNRLLLRSEKPTLRQLLVWDRLMVPVSRLVDRLLGYRVGKSVLAVWTASGVDVGASRAPAACRADGPAKAPVPLEDSILV
jgi:SAM-dependent methyltransferase